MKFLNPEDALRQFNLYGALTVADLGAGGGHFSLAAARRLEGGKLYVIDVDSDMLQRIVQDTREQGHGHVHALTGDLTKARNVALTDEALDRAIIANVLFSVSDRDMFIREVSRLLKPGGKILFIDWAKHHSIGPHHTHKVDKETAHGLFARHGFKHEKDIDAGDYHYGMILVKQ